MSKPAECEPALILLVGVGYPMATALMLFAAWASFWTLEPRVPISPAAVQLEDQHEELAGFEMSGPRQPTTTPRPA
jgi:hypothetical protein